MQKDVVTVGVDLAKNVFQVHAIDAMGRYWCGGSFGAARY